MNTNLRLDVNVLDAQNIIKWLRNKDVTKFLNEDNFQVEDLSYFEVDLRCNGLYTCSPMYLISSIVLKNNTILKL